MKRIVGTTVCVVLMSVAAACARDADDSGLVPASDTEGVSESGSARQQSDTRAVGRSESELSRNPTAGRTGALPDGGVASCAEAYAPDALTGRAFAFDGVVLDIGPSVSDRGDGVNLGLPGVTFKVREWFSGGRTDTVTVDVQTTGSPESSDAVHAYGIGSRLLVSGEARWGGSPLEAPIAWGCGFSRYYDPETAMAWHDALAR